MSLLPEPFRSGEKVSGLRGPLNQLREAIVHILTGGLIKTGPGLVSSRQGDHYMISLLPDRPRPRTRKYCPLELVTTQPDGYPAASGDDFAWITFGSVNQLVPTGVVNPVAISSGDLIYIKVITNAEDEDWTTPLVVLSAEIVVSATALTDTGGTATKPAEEVYFLLGQIVGTSPALRAQGTGCGNLVLGLTSIGTECVIADVGDSESDPVIPPSPGGSRTVYQIRWQRA